MRRLALLLAALGIASPAAADCDYGTSCWASEIANDAGIYKNIVLPAPGPYDGISVTGQYNSITFSGIVDTRLVTAPPSIVVGAAQLTDDPLMFFYDLVIDARGWRLDQDADAYFIDDTIIDAPPSGPLFGGDGTGSWQLYDTTVSYAAAPEPAAWVLMITAIAAAGARLRRRRLTA